MTTTIEAPQESQAPEVAALSEDTRKELIALRESGMTLAELKARFPQLTSEQIREVLPPGNKREAKQREAKTEVTKASAAAAARRSPTRSRRRSPSPSPSPSPSRGTSRTTTC
jgi:hypothetical protein